MVQLGEIENTKLFLFFLNTDGLNSDGDNFGKGHQISGHNAGLHSHSMQPGQLNLFCFCVNAIFQTN